MYVDPFSFIFIVVLLSFIFISVVVISYKSKVNDLVNHRNYINKTLFDKVDELHKTNKLLSKQKNKTDALEQEISSLNEQLKRLHAENTELRLSIRSSKNSAEKASNNYNSSLPISSIFPSTSQQNNLTNELQSVRQKLNDVSLQLEMSHREIDEQSHKLVSSFETISTLRKQASYLHKWISDTCEKALSICQSSVFTFDWDGDPSCLRLYHALDEQIIPQNGINIHANFISQDTGEIYETTLHDCTCKDFKFNTKGSPCKHMYALALQLGIFLVPDRVDLHALLHDYAEQKSKLDQQKKEIFRIVNTRSQRSPWLAEQLAQYKYERELSMIDNIPRATKKEVMKEISSEKRAITKERNMLKHQLHYLCLAFPWIEEFITARPSKEMTAAPAEDPEWEVIRDYLSANEYAKLSSTEKYQLALDRYEKRHRSRSAWEAGIIYERFVGYFYEQNGYAVQYRGALDGYDDLGRDIIASKNGTTHIIQCKRWSQAKTIHEKHIFQLYGSTILYRVDHPNTESIPVFVTTTALSDRAAAIARELNIVVYSNVEMINYPKIKCNIGKDGEKIYHLPFDQQYDKIVITPETGERYCTTVAEAEAYGFRRAKKWIGSQAPGK